MMMVVVAPPAAALAEANAGEGFMDLLLLQLQRVWEKVLEDPNATSGNRRHAKWKLENLRRSDQGEPPLPMPEELRDPGTPNWSSTLYLIEHPVSQLG
jgi:hypothetical protein